MNDLITYKETVKGLGLKAGETLSKMSKAIIGDQFIMIGVYTGEIEYFKDVGACQHHALYTTPNAMNNDAITSANPMHDILSRMNEPDEDMQANVWLVHHRIEYGHDTDIYVPVFLTNNRNIEPETVLTVHYGDKFLRGTEGTDGHYVAGKPPDGKAPNETVIQEAFETFVTTKCLNTYSIAMSYGAICRVCSNFTDEFKKDNKILLKELKATNSRAVYESFAQNVIDKLNPTACYFN